MKRILLGVVCLLAAMGPAQLRADDPRLSSWLTKYSGQYARIFETTAELLAGTGKTTWVRGSITQAVPAYCSVQGITYSTNWVYIRTTGLGIHKMGPWFLDGVSTPFPALPKNQSIFYRIPRTNTVPGTKTLTGLGAIGLFVDGVAMFDSRDGQYWNGTAEANGNGNWNRDAYINEGLTFDPAYAHQPGSGQYHYHANPKALRHLLGDNVSYTPASGAYAEIVTNASPPHSPILGWVNDGYPIYGPYGYANPSNPASGTRRMISGYVPRNGQFNTQNLSSTGRASIPPWAVRLYGGASNAVAGPAVSTTYPLGRYMEDNDYLGDLGYTQTTATVQGSFDLDEYNGRNCVTPEFPSGTYAYFVSIASNGVPVFPYNIGRAFRGAATGGTATTTDAYATNYEATVTSPPAVNDPIIGNGTVTITWQGAEGGTYQIETSTNMIDWTVLATNAKPVYGVGSTAVASSVAQLFTRVTRTALAVYDTNAAIVTVGGGGAGGVGIISISPASGARGASVPFTITLDATAPPAAAPVISLMIGTNVIAGASHTAQTTVTGTFAIGAGADTGAKDVLLVWPGPPANPAARVTNSLPAGFTIN